MRVYILQIPHEGFGIFGEDSWGKGGQTSVLRVVSNKVMSTNNSRTTRMSLVPLSSEAAKHKASLSYGTTPKSEKVPSHDFITIFNPEITEEKITQV